MKRRLALLFVVVLIALVTAIPASAGRGNETPGVIYVTGQGLYYDTFVTKDPLPFQGKFQKLENGTTEFGPGEPGYLGGRWWEDTNANGRWTRTIITSSAPCLDQDALPHNSDKQISVR